MKPIDKRLRDQWDEDLASHTLERQKRNAILLAQHERNKTKKIDKALEVKRLKGEAWHWIMRWLTISTVLFIAYSLIKMMFWS